MAREPASGRGGALQRATRGDLTVRERLRALSRPLARSSSLLLAGTLACSGLAGQEPAPTPADTARVASLLSRELASSPATGGIYAVVTPRGTRVLREFGSADLDGSEPMTAAGHLFHLGTFGEVLLSATAAWAAGRGLVDLDAPIHTVAPELPEGVARASLAELLTHTAGLDDTPLVPRRAGEAWTELPPHEELALLSDRVLLTDPGVIRSPSRFGPLIAAHVLESASGSSFEELFEEAFAGPLALRGAVGSLASAGPLQPVAGHAWATVADRPFGAAPFPDEGLLRAHERFWATGEDLARLVAAWLSEGEAGAAFERSAVPLVSDPASAPGEAAFGLGLETREEGGRRLLRGRGGGFGYTASLLVVPDRSLAVLFLTNGSEAAFPLTAAALMDAFGAPPAGEVSPEAPRMPGPGGLTPLLDADEVPAGVYRNGAEVLRLVRLPDGDLAVDAGTALPLRVRTLEDGAMDAGLPDGRSAMRFRLHRDRQGRIYAVLRGRAFGFEG